MFLTHPADRTTSVSQPTAGAAPTAASVLFNLPDHAR